MYDRKISNLLLSTTEQQITQLTLENWENILPVITNKIEGTYVEIDYTMSNRFLGDFHGLLLTLGVRPSHLHIVTRLNGLTDSCSFVNDTTTIFLPDISSLDKANALIVRNNALINATET